LHQKHIQRVNGGTFKEILAGLLTQSALDRKLHAKLKQ
jgi:hypothetical protein